jgi:hypothetical protein
MSDLDHIGRRPVLVLDVLREALSAVQAEKAA